MYPDTVQVFEPIFSFNPHSSLRREEPSLFPLGKETGAERLGLFPVTYSWYSWEV